MGSVTDYNLQVIYPALHVKNVCTNVKVLSHLVRLDTILNLMMMKCHTLHKGATSRNFHNFLCFCVQDV